MNKQIVWLVRALLLIIFSSIAVLAVNADGWLTVSPTNDFHSGRGASLNLDVEQKITGKWSLDPHATFTNVQEYRDMSGLVNLMYAFNPRLELGVGYGHEKFQQYNDSTYEANDVHGVVRVKLW